MVWLKRMMALAVAVLGISGALGAGEGNDVDAMDAESLWKRAEFLEEHSSWERRVDDSVNGQRVNADGSVDWFYLAKDPSGRTIIHIVEVKDIFYQICSDVIIKNALPIRRDAAIESQRSAVYKRLDDVMAGDEKCYVLERKIVPNDDDYALFVKSILEPGPKDIRKYYMNSPMRVVWTIAYSDHMARIVARYTADGRLIKESKYEDVTLNPVFDSALFTLPNLPITVAHNSAEAIKASDASLMRELGIAPWWMPPILRGKLWLLGIFFVAVLAGIGLFFGLQKLRK